MSVYKNSVLLILSAVLTLYGCGDSGGGGGGATTYPGAKGLIPQEFNLQDILVTKENITFKWSKSNGATNYILCRKDAEKENNCDEQSTTSSLQMALPSSGVLEILKEQFFVIALNENGQRFSNEKAAAPQELSVLIQYIKAFNTDSHDEFGFSVSLSRDGTTLVIGSPFEQSNTTGINSSGSNNNSLIQAGAAYIFRFDNNRWNQEAYVKASNTGEANFFGMNVSLSSDGNTLAVAAPGERTNGINAGAVYVYRFNAGSWSEEAILRGSNTETSDFFGNSLDLSGDGKTLVVGATEEASLSTGINGDQGNDPLGTQDAGAVYLFRYQGGSWPQESYIKASNTDADDRFGSSVALSDNGNVLAVGATNEQSNSIEINVGQSNNNLTKAGAVYIYKYKTSWAQEAYIKPLNTGSGDLFGSSVSLSSDGNILAIGASEESSNSNEINIGSGDNSALESGAAYIFRFNGIEWSQQTYIKASNSGAGDYFGVSVSLSEDGNTLAVGASSEDSNSQSVNGEDNNNTANSGSAYTFFFNGSNWIEQAYIKASNTGMNDLFGISLSLSGDGKKLAITAREEDSNSTGVNSPENDNNEDSGAAYIF
ncbi:FG-GAP repeat protein [Vibrio hepatarius]|uniref:FG-GAP repeat protein n=1 Tax=Vibrio hepatarius TaxID=171383 RepID=UPI001C09A9DD|nr:FG-GAP repeat protein [Vibrio hepatarius]MBU2899147.1 FG-GAP repeat protein [Vibrio hepatarius]